MKVRRVREYKIVVKGYWYELAWDEVMVAHGLKLVDDVVFENQETAIDYAKEVIAKYFRLCGDQLEWRPVAFVSEGEMRNTEETFGVRPGEVTYEARAISPTPTFEVTDRHNSSVIVSAHRQVEWRAFASSSVTTTRVIDGQEWTRQESQTRFTPWKTSHLRDTTSVTVTTSDRVIVG